MEEPSNGLATPADFRRARQEQFEEPQRVVLPKLGKAVLLRRPTPAFFLFRSQLPASLAAKIQRGEQALTTVGEIQELAAWMVPLLQEVFFKPKISLNPGPDDISPDWLDMEDVNFIVRWSVGEVEAGGGADLGPFRREREPAPARSGGGDVALPAK